MALRPPRTANGDSLQIWPAGGEIMRVIVRPGLWTEFVPTPGVDAYLVQTPAGSRIVRTSTATYPALLHGDPVDSAQLDRTMDVYAGQDVMGFDVDNSVRFLFTIVDDGTAVQTTILFEAAI